MTDYATPIRLLVLDVDGVLSRGEAHPLDLALLEHLAEMNRAARHDPAEPAVTVCTGRPAPYVEVMLQAIDGNVPGIFENGAGLYLPETYEFMPHPLLGDGTEFAAVRRRLEETLVRSGRVFFQPGKEYSLSLFARAPTCTEDLYDEVVDALGPLQESVDLVYSPSCLNVLPAGIHKGKGIEFLSQQAGYTLEEMLGIGDSDVDIQFLTLVGHSAAPANANTAVKDCVEYVAPRMATEGVRDILAYFGLPAG